MQQRTVTYAIKHVSIKPLFWLGFALSIVFLGLPFYHLGEIAVSWLISVLRLSILSSPIFYIPLSFIFVGLFGSLLFVLPAVIFNIVSSRTGGIQFTVHKTTPIELPSDPRLK